MDLVDALTKLVGPYAALVTVALVTVWFELKKSHAERIADQKTAAEAVMEAMRLRTDDYKEMVNNVTLAINNATQSTEDLHKTMEQRNAMFEKMLDILRYIKDKMNSDHPYWQSEIGWLKDRTKEILKGVTRLVSNGAAKGGE